MNGGIQELVGIGKHHEFRPFGQVPAEVVKHFVNLLEGARCIGPGFLVDEHHGCRMPVHLGGVVVGFIAQFHIGNLFQPKHIATR